MVLRHFSTSRRLIENSADFFKIERFTSLHRLLGRCGIFYGWGRKHSGLEAVRLADRCKTSYVLLEDGFIRSVGLGVEGSPSFSIVSDTSGIYYDATVPSDLEELLLSYDFTSDTVLMSQANEAIALIKEHQISKYNASSEVDGSMFDDDPSSKRILIVAQTQGDMSLRYGLAEQFTMEEMIQAAIEENPEATIYVKIHPDVMSGKKHSDIDIEAASKRCVIIDEDVNPLSLLKHFDKVYTKTSQMGFEALLVGCKTVCFGMPFYAGWGVTDDRVKCERRGRALSVEEVFAAAYILYSSYYDPYEKIPSNIIETIKAIVYRRTLLDSP